MIPAPRRSWPAFVRLRGHVVHRVVALLQGVRTCPIPNGDRRLFALLIFFLPSFWYWTTSLGKDAPVMMGLGLATYGFAITFKKLSAPGGCSTS